MKLKTRNAVAGYLLALPFLLGFAGFYLIPFLWSVRFTFTSGSGGTAFVGLRNFQDIFASAAFQLAAYNTFRFILIGVPLLMAFSFVLALLLFEKFKGATFFRSLFLYPLVLPAASVVIVVQAFFSDGGLVNQALAALGLPLENWIQSDYAFPLLVGLYIWKNCGYDLVLFLAGLAAIPREYREAAASEGASYWQTVRYITLPLMLPTFFFILIVSIINSFKSFREAYLLGGANPHESIYMLQHFMNNNFQNLSYQRLSVAALLVFAVIFALVLVLFRLKARGDQ